MIEMQHLSMRLTAGGRPVTILDDVTLSIPPKQMVAVDGTIGERKVDLAATIAGLDRPTEGSIVLDGSDITALSEGRMARFRRMNIGYIFQSFHLIPTLTALKNVLVPLELAGDAAAKDLAIELLHAVGLPGQSGSLSCAAFRRGAATGRRGQSICLPPADPSCRRTHRELGFTDRTPCDGSLAFVSSGYGTTLVLVTHDRAIASLMHRVIALRDGRIESDESHTRGTELSGAYVVNRFMFAMAWRETRGAWRHFVYFLVCIAVGVSALVGVSPFASHVDDAVSKQAKSLLEGELVRSSHPLSAKSRTIIDTLDREASPDRIHRIGGHGRPPQRGGHVRTNHPDRGTQGG